MDIFWPFLDIFVLFWCLSHLLAPFKPIFFYFRYFSLAPKNQGPWQLYQNRDFDTIVKVLAKKYPQNEPNWSIINHSALLIQGRKWTLNGQKIFCAIIQLPFSWSNQSAFPSSSPPNLARIHSCLQYYFAWFASPLLRIGAINHGLRNNHHKMWAGTSKCELQRLLPTRNLWVSHGMNIFLGYKKNLLDTRKSFVKCFSFLV